MRKILSIILALSIICTLGFTTTLAEDTTETETEVTTEAVFDHAIPNHKTRTASVDTDGRKIGVNQGTIKLVYTADVTEDIVNSITFTDGTSEPIGGVIKTYSGSTVTLTFGELNEGKKYSVKQGDTELTYYNTVAKKIVEEDFSKINTGVIATETTAFKQLTSSGLYYKNEDGNAVFEIKEESGDRYLSVTSAASKDAIVSLKLPGEMIVANVVSKLKMSGDKHSSIFIGNMQGWQYQGTGTQAKSTYDVFGSFTANNGFYDFVMLNSQQNTDFTTAKSASATVNINYYDLNSDKKVEYSKTVSTTANDVKVHTVSFIKMNNATSYNMNLSSIKSGFYTIPAPLGEPVWDSAAKTLTYVMNTDVDTANSNITIGDLPTTASYNAATRELTLKYTGEMVNSYDYTVNFTDLVSADGFNGAEDVVFNNGVEVVNFDILYTTPMEVVNNYIGVNQGTIEIGFEEEIVSNYEKITFTDSKGNAPAGGISYSVDGAKVMLKFGELKENETYTLSVPAVVKGISGNYSNAKTATFVTLPKALVEESFDDTTFESGVTIKGDSNVTYDIKTAASGDKYLSIKGSETAATDYFMGVQLSKDNVTNAKIVSKVIIREQNNASYDNFKIGTMYGWTFGTGAFQYSDKAPVSGGLTGFTANADGFFETVVLSETKTTGAVNTSNKMPTYAKTTIYDTLSNAVVNGTSQTANSGKSDFKLYSNALIKFYASAGSTYVPEISYLKSGFYTLPEIMVNKGYNANTKTITYVMNTDLDTSTLSNITLNGEAVNSSYNETTRELTITPSEALSTGDNTVSLTGVKSADGFKLTYSETIGNKANITSAVLVNADTNEAIINLYEVKNLKFEMAYENAGSARTAQAIISVYDGNSLKDVKLETITFEADSKGTKSAVYENLTQSGNIKVKAMLWDMATLRPLTDVISVGLPGDIHLEAEEFDESSSAIKIDTLDSGATKVAGGWSNGQWVKFENVTLTPYHTKFTARMLPYQKGTVEIWANATTAANGGQLLGTITISEGLSGVDWSTTSQYEEMTTTLSGMTGTCDLYIKATASGCSTDWYEISTEASANP